MHTAMPIQSVAMFHALHVLSSSGTGARSALMSGFVGSIVNSDLGELVVSFGSAVAEELPCVADFSDHIEIKIGNDHLVVLA